MVVDNDGTDRSVAMEFPEEPVYVGRLEVEERPSVRCSLSVESPARAPASAADWRGAFDGWAS